jgi:hypothetical protein
MPRRSDSKRARLTQILTELAPAVIDEPLAAELAARLAPVSVSYLRTLLHQSGVALAPLVEGVNQESLDQLERTLLALAAEYGAGKKQARAVVIEAKARMRWAAARASDETKRGEKAEMLLWAMTWLENPAAFPVWVRLRRRLFVKDASPQLQP